MTAPDKWTLFDQMSERCVYQKMQPCFVC